VETTKLDLKRLVNRFLLPSLTIAIEAGNQTAWVYKALVKLDAKSGRGQPESDQPVWSKYSAELQMHGVLPFRRECPRAISAD
jgi:hypothetical protein